LADRDFDVVVFGATGVTGRQVASYLNDRCKDAQPRWAAAARDLAKLEGVLSDTKLTPAARIAVDVNDPRSLAEMASRTRVVLNLVGPYSLYGWPVIEACVANGAHYVDLTGEIPFVRRVIDAFHDRATKAGVKLVQVCGFESLPPDLAVMLAANSARERWDEALAEADVEVSVETRPPNPRPSDMISGGTLQTIAAMADVEDPSLLTDPAALVTDPERAAAVRRRSPISVTPRRGAGDEVIAPMVPAAYINPAVIQRSGALLAAEGLDGAEPLRYREGLALPGTAASLPIRYAVAGVLAGTQVALGASTQTQPAVRHRIASALGTVLPRSGYGPAADRLEGWRWRLSLRSRTVGGHELGVDVDADGHPGYLATARMVAEAGLLIAEPGATPQRSGCLTPATALGVDSAPRFALAHVRFSEPG
jgi:short subunit dehydrogenase-like uncharacterized protein